LELQSLQLQCEQLKQDNLDLKAKLELSNQKLSDKAQEN